jgi:hypothetical protein
MMKLLAPQGVPSDALVIERVSRAGLSAAVIQAALAHLKASGDYQRLIDEAQS